MIERVQRLPVLLLITFRPEFAPPWSGQPHVSALALTRLGRRDGAAMVDRVVGGKALPAEVAGADRGQDRRRAAVRRGADQDGARVGPARRTPATATSWPARCRRSRSRRRSHDSLLARLDRLAPVKEVAQIGAAIGREFSHALLAAVADRPEAELQAALDQLVAVRAGLPPRHAARGDLQLQARAGPGRRLRHPAQVPPPAAPRPHRPGARGALPETADAQPELLAHHCTQAGLVEKAVGYWYQAGRQAMARSAMVEAAAQLTQALELLAGLPGGPDRDHKELDLQIALGAALIATRGWAAPEVERAYARARELCAGGRPDPAASGRSVGLFLHHLHWSEQARRASDCRGAIAAGRARAGPRGAGRGPPLPGRQLAVQRAVAAGAQRISSRPSISTIRPIALHRCTGSDLIPASRALFSQR